MAMPGYFLTLAVNAGVQSFGLYNGIDLSTTEPYMQHRGREGRIRARDIPYINVTHEIVMVLPALVQARRQCCQFLLDEKEWKRAQAARCVLSEATGKHDYSVVNGGKDDAVLSSSSAFASSDSQEDFSSPVEVERKNEATDSYNTTLPSTNVEMARSYASGKWQTSGQTCPTPDMNIPKEYYKSQGKEDRRLMEIFGKMCNGTYIEMGALDGVRFSNTYVFNRALEWKGVLIELIRDSFNMFPEWLQI